MDTKPKKTRKKVSRTSKRSSATSKRKKKPPIAKARRERAEYVAQRKKEINAKIRTREGQLVAKLLIGGITVRAYAIKLKIRMSTLMGLMVMGSTEAFSPVKCNEFFKAFSPKYFSDFTMRMIKAGYAQKLGRLGTTNIYALTPKGRDLYDRLIKSMTKFTKKHFYGVQSKKKI